MRQSIIKIGRTTIDSAQFAAAQMLLDALAPMTARARYAAGVQTVMGVDDNHPLSMIDYTPVKKGFANKYGSETLGKNALRTGWQLSQDLVASLACGQIFSAVRKIELSDAALQGVIDWYQEHQPILHPGEEGQAEIQRLAEAIEKAKAAGLVTQKTTAVAAR